MIGYTRPDGFAAIPYPARRPDGGLQDFLKNIAHQQANTSTTGVGRAHISCYASAQQCCAAESIGFSGLYH